MNKPPAAPGNFLRPPGVLSEKDLKARCVACGQCVAVCRFDCLELAPDYLWGPDTPKIYHRKRPCFLCMKCSDICPTGALLPTSMEKAGMGTATLNKAKCVDYQREAGVMCWTCYERCPLKGTAIELKYGYIPEVAADKCAGCGVCEYVCPVRAITVTPARFRK